MHTLLVVDDQRGMRLLLGKSSTKRDCVDYSCQRHRSSNNSSLTLPDLMLLDLKLPKLDGRTVLQKEFASARA